MPFGWGGFDASAPTINMHKPLLSLQCLSAGGALMPIRDERDSQDRQLVSPMPFGWGGFDAYACHRARLRR